MKIYGHDKGFILVGKASEIQQKLAEYRRQFDLLKDWVEDVAK